ncbi:MAG: transglutaminase domain-containing protein [Bdellovibrionia bacterium]
MKTHQWLGILSLSLGLGSAPSFAVTEVVPSIAVTHDSSFQLPGTVPSNARWLAVAASKEGKEVLYSYISAAPGAPLPTIYLSDGPGVYTVTVYQSDGVRVTDKAITSFKKLQVRNDDTQDHQYLLPSLQVQSDAPEIVELAQKLTRGKASDYEKARAIHDWVASTLSYDEDGVLDKSYTSRSLDALTALQSKVTVCEGYSALYAAIARAAGIRTRIVTGKAYPRRNAPAGASDEQICQANTPGHGWNEVFVNNRWISVDTTFDSGYSSGRTNADFVHFEPKEYRHFDGNVSDFAETHLRCEVMGI